MMDDNPNRVSRLEAVVVQGSIPELKEMSPGILYVSRHFSLAIHLCPCGCGYETVTPLGNNDWKLDKESVTMTPSILNTGCQSHYWVTNGRICWC